MARKSFGFMQLSSLVGFCCFYAWYLMTFFGSFIFFPTQAGFVSRHLGQAIYFAGSLVGSAVFLLHLRKTARSPLLDNRGWFTVITLLGLTLPVCMVLDSLGVVIAMPVVSVTCFAAGIALSAGFAWWDCLPERFQPSRRFRSRGFVFVIGGLVFLGAQALLSQMALGLTSILLLVASALLTDFINTRTTYVPTNAVDESVAFFRKARSLDALTCIVTVPFGFAFILLYRYLQWGILGVFAAVVALDLVSTFILGKNRIIPFAGVLRICMAFVAIGLLAFVLPPYQVKVGALVFIAVIWFSYRTFNGEALFELSMARHLSHSYTAVRGKMAGNIGFLLGLVLGLATNGLSLGGAPLDYVALALVAIVVLGALFLLPFDDEFNPAFRTIKPVTIGTPVGIGQGSDARKCALLAERYMLSPREQQVLSFIIRGRNARYVAGQLGIAENTAKTHIASIYRKVDVHSQQELLDLLDQME